MMKDIIKMLLRRLIPRRIRILCQLKTENPEERKLRIQLMDYLKEKNIADTEEIINYLKSHRIGVFNYFWADKHIYKVNRIKLDRNNGLYYAILNGKRMYFKRGMNLESCNAYFNSLLLEQDDHSPHNYLTKQELKNFEARTVVDCGAAEGIFALSVCDKANEVVLFEADRDWLEALSYTFKDSSNVKIIPKFVGAVSKENITTLDECFMDRKNVDFIKMDIENMECEAIVGASDLLENNKQVKLVVCVYHSQDEEQRVCEMMKGYKKIIKPGYMVFIYDSEGLKEPYLRHGVIKFEKDNSCG